MILREAHKMLKMHLREARKCYRKSARFARGSYMALAANAEDQAKMHEKEAAIWAQVVVDIEKLERH